MAISTITISTAAIFCISSLFCLPILAAEVSVAAASNFAHTLREINSEFESKTEHKVNLSLASSGKIYAQISQGAPFDIFLSADQQKPALLEERKLSIPNSRFTYATGSLVLWSSDSNLIDPQLTKLYAGDFSKLALANPKFAPYGKASLEVLEALALTKSTKPKWVFGENISQTLQFVSTGNAELGFIALSQLRTQQRYKKGSWWIVPAEMHSPLNQDAVLLPKAKDNQAALAFIEFLKSDTAKLIMRSFGYVTRVNRAQSDD